MEVPYLPGLPAPVRLAVSTSSRTAAPRPSYSIKPSEVTVPPGAELGRYRRIIQPFENWNLICDENLKTMKKICNITQSIVDQNGQFAFW